MEQCININQSLLIAIIPIFSIIATIIYTSTSSNTALAVSPYQSGYDHGCKDAKISDSSLRYINQPKRSPLFHTEEFMNGYNAGFSSCNIQDNGNVVDSPGSSSSSLSSTSSSSASNSNNGVILNDMSSSSSSQAVNIVKITLVDSSDRTINDVRLYIKEHPEYATPSSSPRGYTDLKEAFWPDYSPYTDKVDMEISFPDNLFAKGEQFHVCIDKVNAPNEDNINIRCYELTKNNGIEYLTIDTGNI